MSTTKQIFLAILLFQFPFLKKVVGENEHCDTPSRNLFRPSRLLDQHFGLVLDPDDFFEPLILPRWLSRSTTGYLRPWRSEASRGDSGSTVSFDKDKFQANLDVQQFRPDEISVKLAGDNTITIEGKHEEKQDEHGYISRHFIRKYTLPKDADTSRIESKLSSDGVLTVSAPIDVKEIDHKEIPIQQTGEPAKRIENKDSSENKKRVDL
ncbi:protein lethal(2)essential for life-like [Anoplophora glabripennis]|uniref:protein lethal(2)essential for life-like n=1 Tax=Anoplophora glabripennis TaxID=217634 RepID=UPI000874DDB7|nr:protein lethal(2)essential for life-like [Anoplophora glabripennis]